ncbi:hypothetical protein BV898_10579 [Hypsibius exemplaris]|uniref:Uncharacterized protein n=1 Tax=Hypsibius exemplaris TaxID=2072580 RepID=A0A1W0WJ25_HYPEX|nr:hypothetical protein BV898_10579 [Hypsibius exemplaris]
MTLRASCRLVTIVFLLCLAINLALAVQYQPALSEEQDGHEQLQPGMEKRHIFHTGGWGAGGGALGMMSDLKPRNPLRKSVQEDGSFHQSGVKAVALPVGDSTGRFRQLFVSRGWGPGWT